MRNHERPDSRSGTVSNREFWGWAVLVGWAVYVGWIVFVG